jgi:hypothetical protein
MSSPDYDPGHWWRSSDGFREVIGEVIAYFYARSCFLPFETSISGGEREIAAARLGLSGLGAVDAAQALPFSDGCGVIA